MLSILIPVYNFNSRPLLESLHSQAEALNIEYEIVVADDASTLCKEEIAGIASLDYVRFYKFDTNQGRSRIRNFLASKALFRYLLFMDCDAEAPDSNYLKRYVNCLTPNACIFGGRALYPYAASSDYSLELMYNRIKEVNYVKDKIFTTFNFVIDRELFEKVKFDEDIETYGHEDTVFAYKISLVSEINFIDNPLVHLGISKNKDYLAKVECACANLVKLSAHYPDNVMGKLFKVWRIYLYFRRLYLIPLLRFLYDKWHKRLIVNLMSSNPSLLYLDIYKLLYIEHTAKC